MKIGEIIQRVQTRYSSGEELGTAKLMRRYVYTKMLSVRATLVFNKINKKQFLSKWNYSTLSCIELVKADKNACPCLNLSECNCKIVLKSKYKLPKPLNKISGYIIDSVLSVDDTVQFSEKTYVGQKWSKYDKHTSKKPYFYIKDDYLYVSNTIKLKALSVTLMVFDPIGVLSYPSICGNEEEICPLYPMDIEFPIDEDLIDTLVELTVKELDPAYSTRPKENIEK